MSKRFVAIWFRYFKTDWFTIRQPALLHAPFVLASPDHGRMVITAVNPIAASQGVETGMVLADARAIIPGLQFFDDNPELFIKILRAIAEWCIRFTPLVAADPPDGLIFDATGCAHLWGDEERYLTEITNRFNKRGYHIRLSIAGTIGTAWAVARFGQEKRVIENGGQTDALLPLPPPALRLEPETIERLQKLGLRQVKNFITMPRAALRRRFGKNMLLKLDQALGYEEEIFEPVQPIEAYQEFLPCLEPVITATAIEIALQRLLEQICERLIREEKGIRMASFSCYRVDGHIEKIEIGTNRPSHNTTHLFKLFEIRIASIEPALGIELFTLHASKVEPLSPLQEKIWEGVSGLEDRRLSELIDRVTNKIGTNCIHRYLPDEHYWPERSIKPSSSLHEKMNSTWRSDKPRPIQLLPKPEPIEVAVPIPDYPPMLFRYKNKLHNIRKADGPERIEREWWLEEGPHRDYYCVEDENGHRYWLFRSGHYDADKNYQWFIHGFFA